MHFWPASLSGCALRPKSTCAHFPQTPESQILHSEQRCRSHGRQRASRVRGALEIWSWCRTVGWCRTVSEIWSSTYFSPSWNVQQGHRGPPFRVLHMTQLATGRSRQEHDIQQCRMRAYNKYGLLCFAVFAATHAALTASHTQPYSQCETTRN